MKPNILIISGKNPLQARGGYASYAYSLAKILTRLGYHVQIFCFGSKNTTIKSQLGTVQIIESKVFSSILKHQEMAGLAILFPKLAISIHNILATNSPAIIWGLGPWGFSAAFLKILFPKKIILLSDYFTSIKHEFSSTLTGITIKDHGFWNKLQAYLAYSTIIQLYSIFELFLLKMSDNVITHYQSTEKILRNQFKINHTKFIRLPYVIELEKTSGKNKKTPKIKGNAPLIVSICRHDGRKGIIFLLRSFKILNQRGLKYSAVIIGDGKLRKKHLDLARKLKLKNVRQPGSVVSIKPYLNIANVFILPSLEEGSSSLAILEAMKAGLPIIATNIDGIPEDLENNKSALLVSPGNSLALANAIEKILRNSKLGKILAVNAKKSFHSKHNLVEVNRSLVKFLHTFQQY